MRARRVDHLVAPADLGDDLEVVLQLEQGGERRAHQRLVVGQQQPDRSRSRRRTGSPMSTRRRQPPAARAGADRAAGRGDPLAQARPGRCRAGAGAAARRRRSISSQSGPSAIVQWCAPGVAHHVGHALPHHPAEQLGVRRVDDLDARRRVRPRCPAARSTSRAVASSPASVTSR